MADFDFKITVDNTAQIMAIIDEKADVALKQCGEVIEGYAKEDCPVDTGLLHNSLTYALAGQAPAVSAYHADKTSTGESATTGTSGAVRFGGYSKPVGNAGDHAVYVGTNVEYGPAVEFRDISHHVGKAHFLRDAGLPHVDELREVCQAIFKSI